MKKTWKVTSQQGFELDIENTHQPLVEECLVESECNQFICVPRADHGADESDDGETDGDGCSGVQRRPLFIVHRADDQHQHEGAHELDAEALAQRHLRVEHRGTQRSVHLLWR